MIDDLEKVHSAQAIEDIAEYIFVRTQIILDWNNFKFLYFYCIEYRNG